MRAHMKKLSLLAKNPVLAISAGAPVVASGRTGVPPDALSGPGCAIVPLKPKPLAAALDAAIRIGGIGVIVAVFGIMVFLAQVVVPRFVLDHVALAQAADVQHLASGAGRARRGRRGPADVLPGRRLANCRDHILAVG